MSEIKERPILFSAPMVRAILEGRKTVTRRAVKGFQIPTEDTAIPIGDRQRWSAIGQRDPRYGFCVFGSTEAECAKELEQYAPCPHGRRGDRLWVRETFAIESNRWADDPYSPPHKDGRPTQRYEDDKWDQPHYKATDAEPELWYDDRDSSGCRWKPSIHMPRWASRILLEITDVRVERLQDISRADIRAEGLQCPPELASDDVSPNYRDWYPAAWRELWESTGGNWDANPWVWVVEFKRVTP
jgi:hypothetical protein